MNVVVDAVRTVGFRDGNGHGLVGEIGRANEDARLRRDEKQSIVGAARGAGRTQLVEDFCFSVAVVWITAQVSGGSPDSTRSP